MKYIKSFEMYNKNDELISKELSKLELSITSCPSTKNLYSNIENIVNLFNVYGMEKSSEVISKLKNLQKDVETNYNASDYTYLLKDDDGLKHAPTSQLKRVLSLLEK